MRPKKNLQASLITSGALRACIELPPGTAVEQLRNFCGRAWEILHTPSGTTLHTDERILGPLHLTLARIIDRGVTRGEFRAVPVTAAARAILASLVAQAAWCLQENLVGPVLGGGCNRAVSDTIPLVLGGLLLPGAKTISTLGQP